MPSETNSVDTNSYESILNYYEEAEKICKLGHWSLDLISGKLLWSKEIFSIFETDPVNTAISYESFLNFVHPDDRNMVDQAYKESIKGKKPYEISHRLLMADGRIKYVTEKCNTTYDENGNPLISIGTVQDITEKKQSDILIEYHNKKLETIIKKIPDYIFILDKNGTFLDFYTNDQSNLLMDSDKIAGSNLKDLFPPEQASAFISKIRECLETKTANSYEYEINIHNTTEYYEARFSAIDDQKVMAITRNLTKKIQSRRELINQNSDLELKVKERTSELENINNRLINEIRYNKTLQTKIFEQHSRQTKILESSRIGTWEWELKNDKLFLSEIAKDNLGIINSAANTLTMRSLIELLHPDDKESIISKLHELSYGKRTSAELDIRIYHPVEGYIWFSKNAFVVSQNEDGKPERIFGTLIPIQEQKRLQLFEDEVLRISTILTGLSAENTNQNIDAALERIGRFLDADRSYIFEFDSENRIIRNTFEWCNNGVESKKDQMQSIPSDMYPSWVNLLQNNENIIIPSVEELTEEWSREKAIIQSQGVLSLIGIPIFDEKTIGFFGLDYNKKKKNFYKKEVNILEFFAGMLANVLIAKRREDMLNINRQNYQTFFDSVDDYLFILDKEGRIITYNEVVGKGLGYTKAELLGKSILEFKDQNRQKEVISNLKKLKIDGVIDCTVSLQSKKGTLIPVETNIKKTNWNNQEAYFCLSKDLTEIKESEQKFSSAFHANSEMMSIISIETNEILDVNPAFLSSLGYSKDEIVGKHKKKIKLFTHVEQRAHYLEILKRDGRVNKYELIFQTKSGEERIGLISAEIIHIGNTACYLSIIIDLTEQKALELELSKAVEEVKAANATKTDFLSRMSHELRTPMNSILGFAQLLEISKLNPGQKNGVEHIIKSGKHLLDLINEVLDISRIEAGRLSISLEAVSVLRVVEDVIEIVKPIAYDRRIYINFDRTEVHQLHIHSDIQRTKQILLNLINNAIKYNREGGNISIDIKKTLNKEREMIRFTISDTGLGIIPENLKKIFIPFERIGAEASATEGTGLGLAVVKKLLEALNGEIGVESTVGVGSTFWIELPYSAKGINIQDISNTEQVKLQENSTKKGKVLLIEDNISNVDLIKGILEMQRPEIQLISEARGVLTIELTIKHKPDLILLDLNLPDMHGKDVLKSLKSHPETCNIPVVIISADAMPHQLSAMMNSGAEKYLTKPIEIFSFIQTIDEYTS